MCTTRTPKPPPPPPVPALSLLLKSPQTLEEDINSNIYQPIPVLNNPTDCIWAEEDPELRRACIVSRICLYKHPHRYIHKKKKSIIQVGPTCGLAALSMLLDNQVSLDEILSLARSEGFTNHGEMLSCKDMGLLVEKVLNSYSINNIKFLVENGNLYKQETIECLLNGGALLVPYDADVNHSPALKNGHTAHWCLVSGVILIDELDNSETASTENVYVLCRHGKSQHLSAWKLADLAKSNSNLWEFSPKKKTDGLEYVQPVGGLGGENGLRSQYLIFNWV